MKVLTTSITINQINYLIALKQTGSFSAAAEVCSITQSTLSTMIKKLEEHIQMPLFDRKTKPIRLTEQGEALIAQFMVVSNEFENLIELIHQTNEEFFGTFKIGIIPTLAPFLLPLLLPSILSKYPKVDFHFSEITTNEIVNKIRLRELDVGVLSLPIEDENLIQKTLFVEDFLVYDSRGKSQKKSNYAVKDIDISRLWLLEESHCITSQIGKICHLKKKQKLESNLIFNSGSILSLLEVVRINEGLTLLPKLATLNKDLIRNEKIFQIKSPTPAREIGVISHKSFVKKNLLKLLEEEIKSVVNPHLKSKKTQQLIEPSVVID